ncbi:hypothetical protein E4T39_08158 [Aureobasidium subglaciale]|nr:hypothetical protein E4T39_08158 [Aureobasidium subglaciale]
MRGHFALAAASFLAATSAFTFNGTAETVTVTHTSWSTIVSTLPCPSATTVTLCNAQCSAPPAAAVNNVNVVYETLSEFQAGQVVTISGTEITLAQRTTLTVSNTISDLLVIPDSATNSEYTAAATITNVVYPSSLTANNGQVVTCPTGVTTISGNGVILTKCPCTVQSTVLELTASRLGAVPTALVPSSDYIVKIIYVYIIEYIVEQIPTTITRTATSILTTVQAKTDTTATTTAAPTSLICPSSMAAVNDVVFMLECDSSYDGVSNLRRRQAINLPGVSAELYSCLSQCASEAECVALSFDDNTSVCRILTQFSAQVREIEVGNIFATVVFRPAVSTNHSASTSRQDSTGPSSPIGAASSSPKSGLSTNSRVSMTASSSSGVGSASMSSISGSSSSSRSSGVPYSSSNSSTSFTSTTIPVALTNCEVVNELLAYGPADAYCSSAYAVATSTSLLEVTITSVVTSSGPTSTALSNTTFAPETVVQTIQTTSTTTSTITSETTTTRFISYITTETIQPTATTNLRRRQARPQASVFASILARPSADVAFVCSCLQSAATISITNTQTVLSTTIVTPIVSDNITVTPPVITLQTTETATITEIVTTTSTSFYFQGVITTTTVQAQPSTYPSCDGLNAYDSCGGEDSYCSCFNSAAGPLNGAKGAAETELNEWK